MALTVGKLLVELGVDATRARRAVDEARRDLESIGASAEKVADRMVAANLRMTDANVRMLASTKALRDAREQEAIQENILQNARELHAERIQRLEATTRRLALAERELAAVSEDDGIGYARVAREVERLSNLQQKQEGIVTRSARTLENAESRAATAVATTRQKTEELTVATNTLTRARNAQNTALRAQSALEEERLAAMTEEEKAIQRQAAAIERLRRNTQEAAAAETERWALFDRQRAAGLIASVGGPIVQQTRIANASAMLGSISPQYAANIDAADALLNRANRLHTVQRNLMQTGVGMTMAFTVPFTLGARAAFEAEVSLEKYKNSLIAVMQSESKANVEFQKLVELSRKPGLDIAPLVRADVAFQSVGVSADKARFIMEQFGNEFAKFGGTPGQFDKFVLDLQHVLGQKTMTGRETMILSRYIPTLRGTLNDLYGTADGGELAKQGISGKQALEDIARAFSNTYRAADSTQNAIKNFKNEIFLLKAAVGEALIPVFRELAPIAVAAIRDIVGAFTALPKPVQEGIVVVAGLVALMGPLAIAISGVVAAWRAFLITAALARIAMAALNKEAALTTVAIAGQGASGAVKMLQGLLGVELAESAVTATGAIAGLGSGIAAAAVAAGPFILAAAAVAAVIYGIYRAVDAYINEGIKSREEMNQELKAHTALLQSKQADLDKTKELISEYVNISNKTNKNTEDTKRLKAIYDELTLLHPELTRGYDAMGNAIGLAADKTNMLADAMKRAADNAKELAQNQWKEKWIDNIGSLQDTVNQLRDAKAALQKGYLVRGPDTIVPEGDPDHPPKPGSPLPGTRLPGPMINYPVGSPEWTHEMARVNMELTKATDALAKAMKDAHADNPMFAGKAASSNLVTTGGGKEYAGWTQALMENAASYIKADGKSSCAKFTSALLEEIFDNMQIKDEHKYVAKSLMHDLMGKGAEEVSKSAVRPGDVLVYRGPKEGTIKDPDGSGYHIGVWGGKYRIDSNDGETRYRQGLGNPYKILRLPEDKFPIKDPIGLKRMLQEHQKDERQYTTAVEHTLSKIDEFRLKLKSMTDLADAQAGSEDGKLFKYQELQLSLAKQAQEILLGEKHSKGKNKPNIGIPADVMASIKKAVDAQKDADFQKAFGIGDSALAKLNEMNRTFDVLAKQPKALHDAIKAFPLGIDAYLGTGRWSADKIPADAKKRLDEFRTEFMAAFQQDYSNTHPDKKDHETYFKQAAKAARELNDELTAGGKGDKLKDSALFKANAKIRELIVSAEDAGEDVKKLQKSFDSMYATAQQIDIKNFFGMFGPDTDTGKMLGDMRTSIKDAQQMIDGTFSTKDNALAKWLKSSEKDFQEWYNEGVMMMQLGFDDLAEMAFEMPGILKNMFSQNYDLDLKAKGIQKYNDQIVELKRTISSFTGHKEVGFDKFFESLKIIQDGKLITPPEYQGAEGRNRAKTLFDLQKQSAQGQEIDKIKQDIDAIIKKSTARNPFEAWKLNLFGSTDANSPKNQTGLNEEQLKKLFQLQEMTGLLTEFTQGITDLFTKMLTDIKDKGFKGLFTSIYQGFKDLLFKMAVEYLSSQLYQLLLHSIFGIAGLGGGGGKGGGGLSGLMSGGDASGETQIAALGDVSNAMTPTIVGERGMELFVPNVNGRIFSSAEAKAIFGGGSSAGTYSNSMNNSHNKSTTVIVVNNNHYYNGNNNQPTITKSASQQASEGYRAAQRAYKRLG